jgi:glycosyltransferase involved in cell wall biosynthesis
MLTNQMSGPNSFLVSVIIPAYNAERFLQSTLASAQTQSYADIEIIVVDDGSTDSTAEIAMAAAVADKRVRVIRQKNSGVAAARNRAIAESRGDFIAPLDADDIWHHENLALQIAALKAAGAQTAVSYAWFVMIDECGRLCGVVDYYSLRNRREVLARQIQHNFIGNASSSVIRRDAVLAVGGYDESFRARNAEGREDQALYIALAERWNFTVVPKILIAYRVHPNGMAQDTTRMTRSYVILLSDLRRRRPDLPGYWFGRGLAQVHINPLTSALHHGRWRNVAKIVASAAQDGSWCLVDLLGRRLPGALSFSLTHSLCKFRPNSGFSTPRATVDQFWRMETDN